MLKNLLSPDGKTGIIAASLALLIAVSVANVVAFEYIEHRPVYPGDPASRMTVRSWRGLFDLEDPVDTIILGDSTAGVDLLTGPISDRLGGRVLNLSNNIGSSVLSDAWMLEYYLSNHGAPKNVILLRSCAGYEVSHSVEFMAAVPLGWGYWERLGSTPVWRDSEPRDLFIAKYAVLYSDSDTLSTSLLSLFGNKPKPYPDIRPSRFYSGGIATQSELETIRNGRPAWVYGPFSPSPDSGVALDSMSSLAERYGFQLYLCVGPEWDEAYRDPGRLGKVNSMIEYLGRFADPKYTHLINKIRVFQSDQMQNPNHLRPGAEKIYTEAIIDGIVSLKNGLAPYGETAVQLDKVTLNRNVYQVGGKPKIRVSLSAQSGFGTGTLSGSVSCLVKASGTEDESWVARSSAVAFSMGFNGRSDVDLTLDIGTLESNGNYDLVVFLRQDTESLAYEGRTVLSDLVVVNPAIESITPGQLSLSPDDWDGDKLSQPPAFDAGGVTLKNTGPAGNQGIVSAFPLGSDNFKVSIDYEAQQLPGPKDKGTRSDAIFSIRIGNQQYSLAYTTDAYGGHYRYQAWPAALAAFVPAPGETSGRLRLRRDNTTLWAETWNNGTWVTIGSIEVPANISAYVWLGTFSDTGQPVSVRFSNLIGE